MKYSYLIALILLSVCHYTAWAQDVQVSGKVTAAEDQSTLPGVNVIVKGTTFGTTTDANGNYSLAVPGGSATLVFSFIGFSPVEVAVDNRTTIDVTMEADILQLGEVVVIGYGTQKKVDLTGSVGIVDTEEMRKISNSNISTAIQGKIPGVQVTTDGQPGADPVVRIRGLGSFGPTSPLYVVDGVVIGETIRDFSPNDIESIQVMKDASAAAIYGARAANGVVIITTKQGKKNQPIKIEYSGYVGVDQVEKGVYDVMDSRQYGEYITMAFGNSDMDVPSGYDPASANYIDPNEVNTDWEEEAFKTGIRQNHNINLSGGGEKNTYNLSLDYFKQQGTIEGAGPNLERYTARLNNTMDVKFLKLKTGLVYSHSDQDNMALSNANEFVQGLYGAQFPVMASALITPPTIKAYDESTWVLDDKISAASEYTYDSYGYGTYFDNIHGDLRVTNVLLTNNLLARNSKVDRLLGSGSVTVDFLDMFGVKSNNHKINYNLNLSHNKTFVNDFTFVPAFIQSTTNYLTKSSETLIKESRDYSTSLIENFVSYDGSLGLNHVAVVAGTSFQRDMFQRVTSRGVNMTEPYYLHVSNALETSADSYEEEAVLWSYFGRVNYEFDEKYLLSATIRYDGSSRLSPMQNQDIFPAASIGWRIDREKFFPVDESVINLFKIRGSYGELGSISNLGPYNYMDLMPRLDYTYSFDNTKVNGSARSNFVNERLIWEKKKTIDVGLDLGLLGNQLEFTFDWFKAESEGLHYGVRVPTQAGFTNDNVVMNAATVVNSGLEFMLSYHLEKGSVKFDVSANMSTLRNQVNTLGVLNLPRGDGNSRSEVGREIGSFYGYVFEGIFQSQEEIDNRVNSEGESVTQNGAQPGDAAYADLNNDGQITNLDQTYLGSGLPDVNYGLNIRAQWKGIDLSIFTFGAAGFKAVDFVDVTLRSSYGALNKSVELLDAWTPENPSTTVPRVANRATGSITNDAFSQRFLQNASYLKLANIQLGYNFPDKFFGKYLSNVRVYLTGQNLFTFSKYRGYNVDFAGGTFTPGYNYASYPTPRTVMFGAQFAF
jgi:TonB-dependent starch-binding outer membrane protein SusC